MIEVVFDFANAQESVAITERLLGIMRRAAQSVLENEGMRGAFEISLSLVDKPAIRSANAQYRGIDRVTDVLSFPLGENGEYPVNPATGAFMLGDIVICAEKAVEQAAEYGHSEQREFGFLCAHSVLHLIGYDHVESEAQGAQMFAKQEAALKNIGLTRE